MLRTKGGDHNSYMSSDEVNNLDWEALTPESDQWKMANFYRELIALRRANPFFTKAEVSATVEEDGVIQVQWTLNGEIVAAAIINPGTEALAAEPEAGMTLLFGEDSGEIPARSVRIMVK